MAAELSLPLSHLKQLLTCSLCHGFLRQATCLCCNHHFCMACILDFTSKTGSCCPKCNLPATKQQAKYSPEFDKLVAIYQSLELAVTSLHPYFPENIQELNDAGSRKHNHKGQNKRKQFDRVSVDVCSPCPVNAEKQHLADGFQDSDVCASEQKSKKMASYRGHLPLSKRVQLACPLSRGTTEHDEITSSLETKGSLTSEDMPNNRVDLSKDFPVESQDISCQHVEPSMAENEMPKDQFCLPLEDAKEGLVIGNVVGIMAKLNEASSVLDGHGDGTDVQPLKSQDLILDPKFSHKASTECRSKQTNFALDQVSCAFCQTSNDSLVAGPMTHYERGVPVKAGKRIKSLVSVHQHCAEWAPNVYYVGDVAKNLLKEVARGQKLKCSCCGLKGAVLGCLVKRCVKSFHYPCARTLSCRWDDGNFLVLCPEHVGSRLPSDAMRVKPENIEIELKPASGIQAQLEGNEIVVNENLSSLPNKLKSQALSTEGCEAARADKQATLAEPKKDENPLPNKLTLCTEGCEAARADKQANLLEQKKAVEISSNKWSPGAACNWVLCGSGLKSKASDLLASLVSHSGAKFTRTWDPCVTHLITGTDEMGAASRTLKFLLATLAGTWILRPEWLEACISACQPISEEPFEVNLDIHGMVGGPKHARLLAASRAQELFEGLEFYLLGDYAAAYKEDLQALIKAAGGRLLTTIEDGAKAKVQVVVYNADTLPQDTYGRDLEVIRSRWWEAKSMACKVEAHVVRHTWILDSIAAYEVQPFH